MALKNVFNKKETVYTKDLLKYSLILFHLFQIHNNLYLNIFP
jgi:hypothetical protein